jgi:hypothetical protein
MGTQSRKVLRWTAVLGILLPGISRADTFTFNNINLSDFNALVNEFSANSQYTTVTPPSSLGGLWGFEFGVIGGINKAPDTLALVQRSSPNTTLKDNLYHAGVIARVGLPYGLTGEALYIPKTTISSAKIGRWGIGAQWTLTDSILDELPVNIAVKGYYTKTTLSYGQVIQNASTANIPINANINFDDSLYGLQALVGYKILVLEPYLGLGWTKAKGKLAVDASGTATILDTSVFGSGAQSTDASPTSSQFLAGVDFRLGFFSLGAEYEYAFKKSGYTGRLSFRF